MSIVKNTTSTRSTHFTIKTLSGLDDVYEIRKYLNLTNADFFCNVNPDFNHTVLIMAEIPSGATGYIFGQFNESASVNDFYIKVESNVVTWKYKNNPLVTHAREDGVHIYGYVGGKPVYDYQALSQTAATGRRYANPTIGGAIKIVDLQAQHSYCSNIKIYCARVQGRVTETPSEATAVAWSAYYPASFNGVNTGRILETMYRRATITPDGTSYEASSECVTYGVQLDDLRYLTGSGYRDLLALICEDGGVDTDCGWDASSALPAYRPQAPYASHAFAFDLHGVKIKENTEPSGGESGLLIQGRKPKWSIWNDSVKHGFYIYRPSDTSIGKQLRYNIFKEFNFVEGIPAYQNTGVRLEWFDGYSTAYGNHSPAIQDSSATGAWSVEYNNGQACRCDNNYIVGGNTTNGKTKWIFLYSNPIHGSTSVRVGNAAPWNLTAAELTNIGDMIFNGFSADVLLKDTPSYTVFHALVDDSQTPGYDGRFYCSTHPEKDTYQKNFTTVASTFDENYANILFEFLRENATEVTQHLEYTNTVNATCELKLLLKSVASETIAQRSVSLPQLLRKHNTQINGTLKYGMRLMVDFSNVKDSQPLGLLIRDARETYHDYWDNTDKFFRLAVTEWIRDGSTLYPNQNNPFATSVFAKVKITTCRATAETSYSDPKALRSIYTKMLRLIPYSELSTSNPDMRPPSSGTDCWRGYVYNDGTTSASENQGTDYRHVQSWSRYLVFKNDFVDLSIYNYSSIHVTFYTSTNAPILTSVSGAMNPIAYAPQQELSVSPAVYALYASESSERTLAEAQGNSVVVQHKLRLYNLVSVSGQSEKDWQVIASGTFRYNVVMYVNNSTTAIVFPISAVETAVRDAYGKYECTVHAGRTIEGRWHNPGCYHYIEIDPGNFYEIEIKQLTGTINAGDCYSISLATYNP